MALPSPLCPTSNPSASSAISTSSFYLQSIHLCPSPLLQLAHLWTSAVISCFPSWHSCPSKTHSPLNSQKGSNPCNGSPSHVERVPNCFPQPTRRFVIWPLPPSLPLSHSTLAHWLVLEHTMLFCIWCFLYPECASLRGHTIGSFLFFKSSLLPSQLLWQFVIALSVYYCLSSRLERELHEVKDLWLVPLCTPGALCYARHMAKAQ